MSLIAIGKIRSYDSDAMHLPSDSDLNKSYARFTMVRKPTNRNFEADFWHQAHIAKLAAVMQDNLTSQSSCTCLHGRM